jgi:hypothetical protein
MARLIGWTTVVVCLLMTRTVGADPEPQSLEAPTVATAADGIFEAFKTHPIVGLGDYHGIAQEEDFYAALVRNPRFATEVGNVVVEFGSAANQEIADRYLAGETIPYTEMRKIWSDRVGWIPNGVGLGYMNFFAQVRAVNSTLPSAQRIRIFLGDPPIDWTQVHSKADWLPLLRQRDIHAAALIEREILAKKKKALVIYGGLHFFTSDDGPLMNLGPLIRRAHSDALFVITPYAGFNERACSQAFEKKIRAWPVPALASPVRSTKLEAMLREPGCHTAPVGSSAPEDQFSGIAGDALLYLGPAHSLTRSPLEPDIYLDADYRAENSRRYEIITGKPLTDSTVDRNPTAPLPFRP